MAREIFLSIRTKRRRATNYRMHLITLTQKQQLRHRRTSCSVIRARLASVITTSCSHEFTQPPTQVTIALLRDRSTTVPTRQLKRIIFDTTCSSMRSFRQYRRSSLTNRTIILLLDRHLPSISMSRSGD
jgi:hypothetical protein